MRNAIPFTVNREAPQLAAAANSTVDAASRTGWRSVKKCLLLCASAITIGAAGLGVGMVLFEMSSTSSSAPTTMPLPPHAPPALPPYNPPALPPYSITPFRNRSGCAVGDLYIAIVDSNVSYLLNLRYTAASGDERTASIINRRTADCTQTGDSSEYRESISIEHNVSDSSVQYVGTNISVTFNATSIVVEDAEADIYRTIRPFGYQGEFAIPGTVAEAGRYFHTLGSSDQGGWGVVEYSCGESYWGGMAVFRDFYYDNWIMYVDEDAYALAVQGSKLNYAYSGRVGGVAREGDARQLVQSGNCGVILQLDGEELLAENLQEFVFSGRCELGMTWLTSENAWWERRNHSTC